MKRTGVIIFLIILFIHLSGIFSGNEIIEKITKPLLVAFLIGYYMVNTNGVSTKLKKWIFLALFSSWIGDILLMFVPVDADFFLAGLSAFLIAHIFYILFFHLVRVKENIKGKFFLLIPVLIYYAVLMIILSPHLGNMKLPVRIYGIVICFMLILALHMLFIKEKKTGLLLTIGALLFVISDSVLAINKFYSPFKSAGIVIMLTYGIAQLLLIKGAIGYLVSEEKSGILKREIN